MVLAPRFELSNRTRDPTEESGGPTPQGDSGPLGVW